MMDVTKSMFLYSKIVFMFMPGGREREKERMSKRQRYMYIN